MGIRRRGIRRRGGLVVGDCEARRDYVLWIEAETALILIRVGSSRGATHDKLRLGG